MIQGRKFHQVENFFLVGFSLVGRIFCCWSIVALITSDPESIFSYRLFDSTCRWEQPVYSEIEEISGDPAGPLPKNSLICPKLTCHSNDWIIPEIRFILWRSYDRSFWLVENKEKEEIEENGRKWENGRNWKTKLKNLFCCIKSQL